MIATKKDGSKNWVGQALPRKEENRLLRGRGKFADDIKLREMLYLKFVRSPYAHARIVSVDTSAAEALAGVHGTLTGAEIAVPTQPFIEIAPDPGGKIKAYPLAVPKVPIKGQPVVAIMARIGLGDDAAELVQVELRRSVGGRCRLALTDQVCCVTTTNRLERSVRIRRCGQGLQGGGLRRYHRQDALPSLLSTPQRTMSCWHSGIEERSASITSAIIHFLRLPFNFCRHTWAFISTQYPSETSDIGGSFGVRSPATAGGVRAGLKESWRTSGKWVETRSEHITSVPTAMRNFPRYASSPRQNGVICGLASRHRRCGATLATSHGLRDLVIKCFRGLSLQNAASISCNRHKQMPGPIAVIPCSTWFLGRGGYLQARAASQPTNATAPTFARKNFRTPL